VIEINRGGLVTVDGEAAPPEALLQRLTELTDVSPKDGDGLPVLSVVVAADPECKYRHVQDAMVQCMCAGIWRISWEMNGRRIDASLPRDGHHPVYVREEIEEPVFVHDETESTDAAEVTGRLANVPELSEGLPTPARFPGTGEGRAEEPPEAEAGLVVAREAAESDGCVRVLRAGEPSPELRVRIVWENGEGDVIYGPTASVPRGGFGADRAVSTSGAHVVVKMNGAACADLDDLKRRLDALSAAIPEAYIVLDARGTVPFEQVFRALEACRRSTVRRVLLQAPPPAETDDAWWWL
jgi:biopolymer transport protein ExbD